MKKYSLTYDPKNEKLPEVLDSDYEQSKDNFNHIINMAQDAFWESIGKSIPNIDTTLTKENEFVFNEICALIVESCIH